ncbi:hypothetical protein HPB49_025819 [Dermacentor silvarum]|nr:hypothetical protein HPB49_025819 [Dermacentor silvarum]
MCGVVHRSAAPSGRHNKLATRMLPGISPPPPFLVSPGTPAIPWPRWLRLFENFTLASGASELSAARRRALLLHCLGPEGQRIFDALPPPPPSNAPDHPPAHPSAGTAPLQTPAVEPASRAAAEATFNSTAEIRVADVEDARLELPKSFQRKTLRVS